MSITPATSSSQTELAVPSLQWVTVDGAHLPYLRQGPGNTALPPLVFLHARVSDHRLWMQQMRVFAGERTVLAHDRRGYGRSRIDAPIPHSHLADLWAVLDAAGLQRVVLVACSLGGRLALEAALDRPERVAGLFLSTPGVNGAPAPALNERERALYADLGAAEAAGDLARVNEALATLWLDGPRGPHARVDGAVRALFLEMNGLMLRAAQPGPTLDAPPSWPQLEQIHVPTELLWGDLDLSGLQARCEQLVTRIPGARRTVLPGVAHLPALEAPQAFNAALAGFLRQMEA